MMTIKEKAGWIVLPALLLIGVGVLEINFPHAMDGFEDNYPGRGYAGFVMLIFELFLCLTWGKIGGTVAILLGTTMMANYFFKNNRVEEQPAKSFVTDDDKNLTKHSLASFALRASKNCAQQKIQNRQP